MVSNTGGQWNAVSSLGTNVFGGDGVCGGVFFLPKAAPEHKPVLFSILLLVQQLTFYQLSTA